MNKPVEILEETEVSFAPDIVFSAMHEISGDTQNELNPEILEAEYPPELSVAFTAVHAAVIGYRGTISKLRSDLSSLEMPDGLMYRVEFVGFMTSEDQFDPTMQAYVIVGIFDTTNNVNIVVSYRADIDPRNERLVTAHRNSTEVAADLQVAQTVVAALNFRTEQFALTPAGKDWLTTILNYFNKHVPKRWDHIQREIRAGIPLIYVATRWGVGNYSLSDKYGNEFVRFARLVEQIRSGK